jgi:hypothetical protein
MIAWVLVDLGMAYDGADNKGQEKSERIIGQEMRRTEGEGRREGVEGGDMLLVQVAAC